MFVKSLRIKNYRSFADSKEIPFEQLTTFIGPNGAGKSTILKALKLFYDVNGIISQEDFHNKSTAAPLSISLTFFNLNKDEMEYFGSFVQTGVLSVEKQFVFNESGNKGTYFGRTRQHEAFLEIRKLAGREKINAYKEFRSNNINPKYNSLPTANSGPAVEQALQDWENNNPAELEWIRAPVQFFGPRNIGGGSLDNYTRFVFIPAVREASLDASEARGSALSELINILVKEVLMQRQDIIEFKRKTIDQFRQLTSPDKLAEIPVLEGRLTDRLNTFVPNSKVHLSLGELKEPALSIPETIVELTEDNFRGNIEGKGHGLQRSFIISIIQELAVVQAQRDEQVRRSAAAQQSANTEPENTRIASDFNPDLILAIEEPELFQHPIRQRYFADILKKLTFQDDAIQRSYVQVILTTHSPYFVSVTNFNEIRSVLKEYDDTGLSRSKVTIGDANSVCNNYCAVRSIQEPNVQVFMSGLRGVINPKISEAFFANHVILVEGVDDSAILLPALRLKDFDTVKNGVPIIDVDGKCNLGRIKVILEALGIKTFIIFDCDGNITKAEERRKHEKENNTLFDLCNWKDENRIPFPENPVVKETFACFPKNLEKTLSEELTDYDLEKRRKEIADQLKVSTKNPSIYEEIFNECANSGIKSVTIDAITQAVITFLQM